MKIVLSPSVPQVIEQHLRSDVEEFLQQHQLGLGDMSSWILHTGGPKILEAVEKSLQLQSGELDLSWESLRGVGNLSSASVLVVLEQVLKRKRCAAGSYSLLAAMGPGFCSELVLIHW